MLKERMKLLIRKLFRNSVYTVRHGLARGLKRQGGLGFLKSSQLNKEEAFLLGLDLRGQTVYDVGGWEGVFTLFFARAVAPTGRVITFEPNPVCYERINANVQLNGFHNVVIQQVALGCTKGHAPLVFADNITSMGSLQKDIQTQLRHNNIVQELVVDVDTLDDQVAVQHLPPPHLVKIDVEGFEYEVLLGMTDIIDTYKPSLYIEIHGVDASEKAKNAYNVVDYLFRKGYSILRVESNQIISPQTSNLAKEGHLYCTYNDHDTRSYELLTV